MGKVILIDTSAIAFRSIFSHERQIKNNIENNTDLLVLPTHYSYFISLLSTLKKIGVEQDDTVILACEGHSWRKDYADFYKAQRADARAEHTLIDWDKEFANINKLHEDLDKATKWHIVRVWSCAEADDIIAVATRFFKDKECIVASSDADLKMLCYYPNVKFFSVCKKCKGSNGMYEVVDKPLSILAHKSTKGDVSDNIIPQENETEDDIELRHDLVNLLELPDYVETAIREELECLHEKEENLDLLPFKNSKEKFLKIYDKDKILTFDYCKQLLEKRKEKKRKKDKLKREQKKKEKASGKS